MNTIDVGLYRNPVAYIAEADITPFCHARIHAFSFESYVDAIAELRRELAYIGTTGKMELKLLYNLFDEEEQIDAAFALPDEELTITPEYSRRIRGRKPDNNGLERLIEFMGAQAADQEEEGSIKVGEARRRCREGKERMRRIVEGKEPDADPEGSKGCASVRSCVVGPRTLSRSKHPVRL
jgi:hypothetical protein